MFVTQDMEVSPNELMNILNRIIGKRKAFLIRLSPVWFMHSIHPVDK